MVWLIRWKHIQLDDLSSYVNFLDEEKTNIFIDIIIVNLWYKHIWLWQFNIWYRKNADSNIYISWGTKSSVRTQINAFPNIFEGLYIKIILKISTVYDEDHNLQEDNLISMALAFFYRNILGFFELTGVFFYK